MHSVSLLEKIECTVYAARYFAPWKSESMKRVPRRGIFIRANSAIFPCSKKTHGEEGEGDGK